MLAVMTPFLILNSQFLISRVTSAAVWPPEPVPLEPALRERRLSQVLPLPQALLFRQLLLEPQVPATRPAAAAKAFHPPPSSVLAGR